MTPGGNETDDPTRVRNQPALTTSSGSIWIVLGAILTVVCVGVLLALVPLNPAVAWIGLVLAALLFVALVVARFTTSAGRRRLVVMASCFAGIAAVTLICVVILSGTAWESLR